MEKVELKEFVAEVYRKVGLRIRGLVKLCEDNGLTHEEAYDMTLRTLAGDYSLENPVVVMLGMIGIGFDDATQRMVYVDRRLGIE